jgi:diacylglycerol kinase
MAQKVNLKRHTISFKHAFDGIFYTFKSQPNLRIHLTIASIVIFFGIILKLSTIEWLIILFTIMWVIVSEMINTSLEAIVNLITDEYHQQAKVAKDVAAGMVLIGAIGSLIVGLAVFIPHLIALY